MHTQHSNSVTAQMNVFEQSEMQQPMKIKKTFQSLIHNDTDNAHDLAVYSIAASTLWCIALLTLDCLSHSQ